MKPSVKLSMMMLSAALITGLSTMAATAATDWTPYLKPMLAGCDFINPTKDLPSRYKASVTSKKVKGNPKIEGEEVITTYYLKNASVFGQPLSKVEYLQGYEWYHLRLYFKDTKFLALRPKFKLPVFDKDVAPYVTVVKNDKSGYTVEEGGYTDLVFDGKQKSITCSGGV